MIAGLRVTYKGEPYIIARIQDHGERRDSRGQRVPVVAYDLAPAEGGPWRTVIDPTADELALAEEPTL